MKKKTIQILILLLIVALVSSLTLTVLSLLNPIVFWALAIASGIFAFKILPKMGQMQ